MPPRTRRMIWPTLILAVGLVWILQGLDVLGGEGGMNGSENWAVIGAVAFAIGVFLLIVELRR